MSDPHPQIIFIKRRGGHAEEHHGGAQPTKDEQKEGAADPGETPDAPAAKAGASAPDKAADKSKQEILAALGAPVDPAAPKPSMPPSQLFADPYKSLDIISEAQSAAVRPIESGAIVDAFRDPFRPIGPEIGGNGSAPVASEAPSPAPAAEMAPAEPIVSLDPQKRLAAAAAQLLEDLQQKIGAAGKDKTGPVLDVKATDEGLLISLTDQLTFAMFPVGSAEPQGKVVQAMTTIAKSLQGRAGAIVIRGHTDGRPYKSADYDNWRLSTARAQMVYYMLTRAGLPDARFERIEGYADRRLRDPANPGAAENRRIEILLREARP